MAQPFDFGKWKVFQNSMLYLLNHLNFFGHAAGETAANHNISKHFCWIKLHAKYLNFKFM